MITLAIDASTYVGTVAVWRGGDLAATGEAAMRGAHEERLMPAVAEALRRSGIPGGPADRIVCGGGPGSFTSLRIAGSIAKGLATGWKAPLLTVPSLALVVAAVPSLAAGRYLAVLDALRGECYVALYQRDAQGVVRELAPARIIPAATVDAVAAECDAVAIGPAHGGGVTPHARGALAILSSRGDGARVELAGWEPSYGRLAEAQVRWEATHGRPLAAG